MRPTQKGGSVVEESTLSTGLALQKEQNSNDIPDETLKTQQKVLKLQK